ncbi:MAG: hypothetical protein Q7K65_00820 [Candidatus Buchananbacteria bacterium]|nr:hypothetical protein [Candidatus Buchananbacteria bacterium]
MAHFISASCQGEPCSICQAPATHKIREDIMSDDPDSCRHGLTAYVCCMHFCLIMGKAAPCPQPTLI